MRSLLLLALVAASAVAQDLDTNRVIKSYVDRYNAQRAQVLGRSNPELLGCKDPECHQDMYMIVTTKGYPCEQHIATTADNVNLTIFRIPHGRHNKNVTGKRPVVFLQHGLLASSADWIINFPEQSFGFLLADAGFDVWMGNVRGNTYGVSSLPAKPTEAQREKFWDFSFDEMAKYDLPAMVEKSLAVSGASQLAAYIGHSQGTLIGFIHFSQQPEWARQKIGRFYALAPIAYMPHTTSPLRYIAKFSESKAFVHFLLWLMGGVEFLPRSQLVDDMCSLAPEAICGNLLNVIAGYDAQNMNNSRLPVYSSKSPAGTSSQNLIHFGQLIQTGSLRAYDYMSDRNMQKYGQKKPPVYYVNQMTLPTALYWGSTDILADPTDVAAVWRDVSNKLFSKEIQCMDHLDFVWGLNAAATVYQPIISQLKALHGMAADGDVVVEPAAPSKCDP